MAPALSSGVVRSSDGLSATNTMPAFGALTKPLIERPGTRRELEHARVLQRDVRHLPDHRIGAIERGAVGQLGEGDQVLLVLRRHESGRDARKPAAVARSGRHRARAPRPTRAARAPRRACRRRTRARRTRLKRAEEPAEQPIGRALHDVSRAPCGWSSSDASAGLSVSELNAEMTVEMAIVSANWR